MYVIQQSYRHLQISPQEFQRVEFILDVLELFKRCSDRMEGTKRPGIEKVFWIYETLFNELDRLEDVMEESNGRDAEWIKELQPAFEVMRTKLTKYYDKTAIPSVYGDGMILDPRLKLYLTTRPEWSGGQMGEYSGAGYSASCCKRYIEQYEKIAPQSQPMTTIWKHPYSAIDDDDFEQMVSSLSIRNICVSAFRPDLYKSSKNTTERKCSRYLADMGKNYIPSSCNNGSGYSCSSSNWSRSGTSV